jgi:hypothetical protein
MKSLKRKSRLGLSEFQSMCSELSIARVEMTIRKVGGNAIVICMR